MPEVTQLDHVSSRPDSPFPISVRQDCSSRAWFPGLGRGAAGSTPETQRWSRGASGGPRRSLGAASRRGSAEAASPGGEAQHLRPRSPRPAPPRPRARLPSRCRAPSRLQPRSRAWSPSGDPGSARVLPGASSVVTGLRQKGLSLGRPGCAGREDKALWPSRTGRNPVGGGGESDLPLVGAPSRRCWNTGSRPQHRKQAKKPKMVSDRAGLGPGLLDLNPNSGPGVPVRGSAVPFLQPSLPSPAPSLCIQPRPVEVCFFIRQATILGCLR